MTNIQTRVRAAVEAEPGLVIEDYLVAIQPQWTPQRWNSAHTSLRRALKQDGSLFDLVRNGSIRATAEAKARARQDSWVHHAQTGVATRERDIQTTGSRAVAAALVRVNGNVSPTTQENMRAIAELSARSITERKWGEIAERLNGIVEHEALARMEIKHREDLMARDRQIIEQQAGYIATMEEQTRNVTAILNRLTGGDGQPSSSMLAPTPHR
ncbi:hypothetical protein [Roseomonas genomospecies 6]|nr:hypothetical protein [Roseomonas genomospecies 6]